MSNSYFHLVLSLKLNQRKDFGMQKSHSNLQCDLGVVLNPKITIITFLSFLAHEIKIRNAFIRHI